MNKEEAVALRDRVSPYCKTAWVDKPAFSLRYKVKVYTHDSQLKIFSCRGKLLKWLDSQQQLSLPFSD